MKFNPSSPNFVRGVIWRQPECSTMNILALPSTPMVLVHEIFWLHEHISQRSDRCEGSKQFAPWLNGIRAFQNDIN